MKRYTDVVISQTTGLPVPATIDVFLKGTATRAVLYLTNNTGGATLPNPLPNGPTVAQPTLSGGAFAFYAADGSYDIVANTSAGAVPMPDVEIYDLDEMGAAVQLLAGVSALYPLTTHTDVGFRTTAEMAPTNPANLTREIVYNDAGTWSGFLDGHAFPANGQYIYKVADDYHHWFRSLKQAFVDEKIDAIWTLDEAEALSNLGLPSGTVGKRVTGTISSMGSGQSVTWQKWELVNPEGGDLIQLYQNDKKHFYLSGELPEIRLFHTNGKDLRVRAVSNGIGLYFGADTVSHEAAQLLSMGWSDLNHIGSADIASVIEIFMGNGSAGRTHIVFPSDFSFGFTRMEWEGTPGYSGRNMVSAYESASALGRTIAFGNSGQTPEYAGQTLARPILAIENFQTTNGPYLMTWGTNTGSVNTPNAWVMDSGLFMMTALDLPELTPANPSANIARLYAVDVAGITKLAYRDSAGTQTILVGSAGFLTAANNLSDVASAATSRINLGLQIGVNVQGYTANLATYSGIAPSANVQSILGAANYAAIRALLALVPGTDVQAQNANLAAIAGLVTAANKLSYWTGAGTAALADLTAAGRALIDDADNTAQRVTLGLVIGTDVAPVAAPSFTTSLTLSGVVSPIAMFKSSASGTPALQFAGVGGVPLAELSCNVTSGEIRHGVGANGSTGFFATMRVGNLGANTGMTWNNDSTTKFHAKLYPNTDNSYAFGDATHRVSEVFAATGTINTSDEREKQDFESIPDALLDAWAGLDIGAWRWIEAVERKGAAARVHIGPVAQQVRDTLEKSGLDGLSFGLLCYNSWDATPAAKAVFDKDGVILSPAVEAQDAGDRWGLRDSQVLYLEAAHSRRRLAVLEARMAALEHAA